MTPQAREVLMTDNYGPIEVADRLQIQDVIFRWCRGIDRLDFSAIRSCFHPDAFDDHIFYRGDIDGLVNCLQERHRSITFSSHAASNILIEFVSPTSAIVETYVRVIQRRAIDPPTEYDSSISEVYCRYVDQFSKVDAKWRISRRTLLTDTAMEYSDREPLHRIPPIQSANRGRRDPTDTLYRQRAEMGLAGSVTLPDS